MKKEFFGFYNPTQKEVEKSWKDGIFIFDANALLNLYRYTDSTRKDFLLALTELKEKLFMPYQVGYEYHNNRNGVIESLYNSYNILSSSVKEACDKIITNLLNQYLRHPSIQIENIKKLQEEFFEKIDVELEKQKEGHPTFDTKDEVLDTLTELYDNKVGIPPTKDALQKIYSEGKERYEQSIPPGYKDEASKRKKGDHHVYGDLIIWKEIIAFANKEKKPIVFITDDRKEDWWTIENGKTLRPREELVKEFYDLTGVRILIYNADTFLHFAKERKLVTQIKEESITEVKQVRKADETFNTISDILKSEAYKSATQYYNSATSSWADFITTNEAFKHATLSMADMIKMAEKFNPATSSIEEMLKKVEGFKPATSSIEEMIKMVERFKPATSSIEDMLKMSERFKPATSSIEDVLKKAEGLKIATQFQNPKPSSIGNLTKSSEILKIVAPSIEIDNISKKAIAVNGKKNVEMGSDKVLGTDKSKNSEDNAEETPS